MRMTWGGLLGIFANGGCALLIGLEAPLEDGNCEDGLDNDGNGQLDCEDPVCVAAPRCQQLCGNNIADLETNEACDGDDLQGKSCFDFGLTNGVLRCNAECGFDLSDCLDVPAVCGDGQLQFGEACDDGNTANLDECSSDCLFAARLECRDGLDGDGDFLVDCADTNKNSCEGDPFCRGFCGDGFFQPNQGEDCEDGNSAPDDGCSADCVTEPGHFFERESNEDGAPEVGVDDFSPDHANLVPAGVSVIHGAVFPAGDEDVFDLPNVQGIAAPLEVFLVLGPPAGVCQVPMRLQLRDRDGLVVASGETIGADGSCAQVVLDPGQDVLVQVSVADDSNVLPHYVLRIE